MRGVQSRQEGRSRSRIFKIKDLRKAPGIARHSRPGAKVVAKRASRILDNKPLLISSLGRLRILGLTTEAPLKLHPLRAYPTHWGPVSSVSRPRLR